MTLENAAETLLWASPILLQLVTLSRLVQSTNEAQRYLSDTRTEELEQEMVSTDKGSKLYPYLILFDILMSAMSIHAALYSHIPLQFVLLINGIMNVLQIAVLLRDIRTKAKLVEDLREEIRSLKTSTTASDDILGIVEEQDENNHGSQNTLYPLSSADVLDSRLSLNTLLLSLKQEPAAATSLTSRRRSPRISKSVEDQPMLQ